MSTPDCNTDQQVNEYDLERELFLAVMIFCSSDYDADLVMACSNEGDETDMIAQSDLENQIELEDMMCFVGCLASKCPEYQLGVKIQEGQEANSISTVARQSGTYRTKYRPHTENENYERFI